MLVRQLLGNKAGTIVQMPYYVASKCIDAGTAEALTERERDIYVAELRGIKIEAPEVKTLKLKKRRRRSRKAQT